MSSTPATDPGPAIPLAAHHLDPADTPHIQRLLESLFAGRASFVPLAPGSSPHPSLRVGEPVTPGTLVACTSGSTGTPKGALLTAANLRASAAATEAFMARAFAAHPGAWLLTVPAHHIAGLQVCLRSLHAGYSPVAARHLGTGESFSAPGFAADTRRLMQTFPGVDLYTSIVPTQLNRLAASPGGIAALAQYAGVLVGGAAAEPGVVEKLRNEGAHLALTYGSSETAGGVIYNGHPLPGVTADIDTPDNQGTGRIILSGPMVSAGYRNGPQAAFPQPGVFRTSDLGRLDTQGSLHVLGRMDAVINTGGMKVLPEDVERALTALPGIAEACAVGIPDPEFGQAVAAGVVLQPDATYPSASLTAAVRQALAAAGVPAYVRPRCLRSLPRLPVTGPGKVDRQAVGRLLRDAQR
ncbi:putative sulfoacetate--CoA ligase [Corynebacterium heidelbergense]|nr:AMP-binding protein [Corynebacterium heidelbergense]WCZ37373.1 putative sulfoacetate--CoA ligase [Corynebacterium heidelbergense]